MAETLSVGGDSTILSPDLVSWIETNVDHPEVAVVGRVMAVRFDIDTDLMRGTPNLTWMRLKQQPIREKLEKTGYRFLCGIGIATRQDTNLSTLTIRPGGYFSLYLLPEQQAGRSLNRKLGGKFQKDSQSLVVTLAPPINFFRYRL